MTSVCTAPNSPFWSCPIHYNRLFSFYFGPFRYPSFYKYTGSGRVAYTHKVPSICIGNLKFSSFLAMSHSLVAFLVMSLILPSLNFGSLILAKQIDQYLSEQKLHKGARHTLSDFAGRLSTIARFLNHPNSDVRHPVAD